MLKTGKKKHNNQARKIFPEKFPEDLPNPGNPDDFWEPGYFPGFPESFLKFSRFPGS